MCRRVTRADRRCLSCRLPQDQHLGAVQGLAAPAQGLDGALDHIGGHARIDFAGELDEVRAHLVLVRFPGEIERIDGNAVTAQAGPGKKRHVAEGLGGCGGDDFQMSMPMRSQTIFISLTRRC